MKIDQNQTIILIVALIVLISLGSFGMYGGMMGGYGNSFMCSHMGGVWCYWPSFGWLIQILIIAILVIIIVKLTQNKK